MCDLHFNRRTIQLRLITTPGEDHCLTADSINISQTLRVKNKEPDTRTETVLCRPTKWI